MVLLCHVCTLLLTGPASTSCNSVDNLVHTLQTAEYPNSMITSTAHKVLKLAKVEGNNKQANKTALCHHSICSWVFALLEESGCPTRRWRALFNTVSAICPALQKRPGTNEYAKSTRCKMKHGMQFVPCTQGTVYHNPFACGGCYTKQWCRCFNIRLRKHHSSLKGTAYSHLVLRCCDCRCEPGLSDTSVISRPKDKLTREIPLIKKKGEACQPTFPQFAK